MTMTSSLKSSQEEIDIQKEKSQWITALIKLLKMF